MQLANPDPASIRDADLLRALCAEHRARGNAGTLAFRWAVAQRQADDSDGALPRAVRALYGAASDEINAVTRKRVGYGALNRAWSEAGVFIALGDTPPAQDAPLAEWRAARLEAAAKAAAKAAAAKAAARATAALDADAVAVAAAEARIARLATPPEPPPEPPTAAMAEAATILAAVEAAIAAGIVPEAIVSAIVALSSAPTAPAPTAPAPALRNRRARRAAAVTATA